MALAKDTVRVDTLALLSQVQGNPTQPPPQHFDGKPPDCSTAHATQ
jgi:hypothetical protein